MTMSNTQWSRNEADSRLASRRHLLPVHVTWALLASWLVLVALNSGPQPVSGAGFMSWARLDDLPPEALANAKLSAEPEFEYIKAAPPTAGDKQPDAGKQVELEQVEPPANLGQLFQRVKGAMCAKTESVASYYKLIKRYHQWRKQYAFLRNLWPALKEPMQLFKEEYAKIDERLTGKLLCEPPKPARPTAGLADTLLGPDDSEQYAQLDVVHQALSECIQVLEARLEANLEQYNRHQDELGQRRLMGEQVELTPASADPEPVPAEVQRSVQRSIDKVKRSLVRAGKQVLINEALALGGVFLRQLTGSLLMGQLDPAHDSTIAPILMLVLGYDVSLAAAYLSDLQFRAVIALIRAAVPFPTCPLISLRALGR